MPGQVANEWTGNAVAVAQEDTITITGTWLATETCTVTCSFKDLVLTLGTSPANPTTADVTAMIVAMINGEDKIGNETRGEIGTNIPEFRELTAYAAVANENGDYEKFFGGSVVLVTTKEAHKGKPFTITAADTSTSGTATKGSLTAATGPNFFDNGDNWSGGAIAASDIILFDTSNVSCLYALDTGIEPGRVEISMQYTGKIGLSEMNTDDPEYPYVEYRTFKALQFANSSGNIEFDIGTGSGSGSGRIRLDLQDMSEPRVMVYNTGVTEIAGTPALHIEKISASGMANNGILQILKGYVGMGYYGAVSGFDDLVLGNEGNVDSDVKVDATCNTLNGTAVVQNGGLLTWRAGQMTTFNQLAGSCRLIGGGTSGVADIHGRLTHEGSDTSGATNTLPTVNIYNGGSVDCSKGDNSKVYTNCNMYYGSSLNDPARSVTFTNGIDIEGCDLTQVTLDLGTHYTVGISEV